MSGDRLGDAEAEKLFYTLDQLEVLVQDDTLRNTLAEADAKTLANTLINVQTKALVNTLTNLAEEAERTLCDLMTRHFSTLLLMRKYQFVTLSLRETLTNVHADSLFDILANTLSQAKE